MYNRILVCLDGSCFAEQILPYVVEFASQFKSRVILFQVCSKSLLFNLVSPGYPVAHWIPKDMNGVLDQAELKASMYLKTVNDRLYCENGLITESVVKSGIAGPEIVNQARKNSIELIALTSHNRSRLYRSVMLSVSDYILHETKVPVLLLKINNSRKYFPRVPAKPYSQLVFFPSDRCSPSLTNISS